MQKKMAAKKHYDFKIEKTTGEDTTFTPTSLPASYTHHADSIRMCPYTEFIPLSYILCSLGESNSYMNNDYAASFVSSWGVENFTTDALKAFNNRWRNRVLTTFANPNIPNNAGKKMMGVAIDKWLRMDSPSNLSTYGSDGHRSSRPHIVESFSMDRHIGFSQISYGGSIGPYSLFRSTGGMLVQKTPEMLAVVLPENYVYMKLHLLVHNTIPLDRVIILINKELDSPTYPVPAFRRLYREFLPKVMRSACQVWKVPQQFIIDNCFIASYQLKETNIIKRQEEIDGLIDEFYEGFGEVTSDTRPQQIATGSARNVLITNDVEMYWVSEPNTTTFTITSTPSPGTIVYAHSDHYGSGTTNASVSSPFDARNAPISVAGRPAPTVEEIAAQRNSQEVEEYPF